ncbi:hypothetical protein HUU53_01070 [Candidatus Micrarchaeota archaeon]|nr:hypothetical protein [Candidatus Micrarchaeota archaeon]
MIEVLLFLLAFLIFATSVYLKFWYAKKTIFEKTIRKSFTWTKYAIIASTLLVLLGVYQLAFPVSDLYYLLLYLTALVVALLQYKTLYYYVGVMKEFGFIEKQEKFKPLSFILSLVVLSLIVFAVMNLVNIRISLESVNDKMLVFLFGIYSLVSLNLLYWSKTIKEKLSEELLVSGYNTMLYAFAVFSFLVQSFILYSFSRYQELYSLLVLLVLVFMFLLWESSSHFCCSDNSFAKVFGVQNKKR